MTTPLSDMRGCKSLHAYAVMLEKQNKIMTRALLEIESSTFDVAGFPPAHEAASWMNGRATEALGHVCAIECGIDAGE
ncbi:TPA: hypothetical protein AB5C23_001255 [Vibrio cholerae]|uniref:hypothetical protein n=1 Tax=Vibrio paracholerae TaxID=650003 RepID=UPI00208C8478|nr:hypothetical protein [Vibrio paracholerae]MCO7020942.1 hypothetical protein [Vibrio paracholerae]GHX29978.1 hypothetical protein VCSRO62_0335 [Vibrio cholerae]